MRWKLGGEPSRFFREEIREESSSGGVWSRDRSRGLPHVTARQNAEEEECQAIDGARAREWCIMGRSEMPKWTPALARPLP